jgi:hypothetical protein
MPQTRSLKSNKSSTEPKIGQVKNPRTGKWIKIDRTKGLILSVKKTDGKYAGVPIIRKSKQA